MQLARTKGEATQAGPARDPTGRFAMPIDVRPRLLYNPSLKSAHFFVPGLVGIILQLVTLFLTSFAVVREREVGTLEQLLVSPLSAVELMLGKTLPVAGIAMMQAARTLAAFSGRDYAVPDDVVQLALPTLRHRVALTAEAEVEGHNTDQLLTELIRSVEVPRI